MEHDTTRISVSTENPIDADGMLQIAQVKIEFAADGRVRVGIFWLPDFFVSDVPDAVTQIIANALREHAGHLESGDMQRRMAKYRGINNEANQA